MEKAKIYYIPIGVETYVPITVDNIESSHVLYGEVETDNRKFNNLIAILESSEAGNFSQEMIRVKIVKSDASVFYVDNFGGIRSAENEFSKLTASNLKKVIKLIEGLVTAR